MMKKDEVIKASLKSNNAEVKGNDVSGFCAILNFKGEQISIIASDGMGWEHVSVSYFKKPKKIPTYELMCFIKDFFWNRDEVVMQLHVAEENHINFHEGCLHLWKPISEGVEIPLPPSNMVWF